MAKTSLPFAFNAQLPEAQAAAIAFGRDLTTKVTKETLLAFRRMIETAIRDGIPPREAALEILGTLRPDGTHTMSLLGLNSQQQAAVNNFRRALRDMGMTPARLEVQMERYIKQKMRERALMIARTETIDALNAGQQLAWNQAQDEGLLDSTAVKEWITTPIDACPLCVALDGKTAPLKGTFPGGYSGPTRHPACRCALSVQP